MPAPSRSLLPWLLLTASLAPAREPDEPPIPPPGPPIPSPEDLSRVRWTRRPVKTSLEHLRANLEREKPLATEEEALALENDGEEANAKILSALGRLPESDDEVDWDATMTRYLGSKPNTLNPIFRGNVVTTFLFELLYVFPFSYDGKFEPFADADVVESWETSEDGLLERIVLREDLTWSDGAPFTAHDVEFSWKVIMDDRVNIYAVRMIASNLRAVKALDDRTVLFLQKELLLTNHWHLNWSVIPKHIYEKTLAADPSCEKSDEHVRLARNPVSNGPYSLVSVDANEIVFERRKEYYLNASGERIRDKPFFNRVVFKILPDPAASFLQISAGVLDDGQLSAKNWKAARGAFYDKLTKVRARQWAYAYIAWNARSNPPNPFFGDPRVRRGLAHAIDHDFMLKDYLFGIYEGGRGVYHPDSPFADRSLQPLQKDLELSNRLLAEAGWTDSDGDGVRDKLIDGVRTPFSFKLSVPSGGTGPELAEIFKGDLVKAGIRCEIELIEWVAFVKKVERREAVASMQVMSTGADPDTYRNMFGTSAIQNGRNSSGYSNPLVDELFEKARRELDPEKRNSFYAQIDRQIYEDHPLTVLLYQPTLWAFSKSLRGYQPSPRGFYGPGFLSIWKKKPR